jgi:hypothetical protein
MFFLATADAQGRPTCSYKGGEPGFVRAGGPWRRWWSCAGRGLRGVVRVEGV